MPAGIDVHTQFNASDTVDDFSVGSKAALAGGTATVCFYFFNQQTIELNLLLKRKRANNMDLIIISC